VFLPAAERQLGGLNFDLTVSASKDVAPLVGAAEESRQNPGKKTKAPET
jgi:hypothetical protein